MTFCICRKCSPSTVFRLKLLLLIVHNISSFQFKSNIATYQIFILNIAVNSILHMHDPYDIHKIYFLPSSINERAIQPR